MAVAYLLITSLSSETLQEMHEFLEPFRFDPSMAVCAFCYEQVLKEYSIIATVHLMGYMAIRQVREAASDLCDDILVMAVNGA